MLNIFETRANLDRGEISSLQLVEAALEAHTKNAELNVFAFLAAEQAIVSAKLADAKPKKGSLHGIPITIKDLFNVAKMPTKAGTDAELPTEFQNPITHAKAVQHLADAGAIILGKTNLHEIALGITGENLATGDVKNPLAPEHQAGGSSSGSAAAVAVGIGLASLGSDTGGSVRIPASFCGIVGFKPTFGWIPLDGALPLSVTCDHAGILSNNVADAHTMLQVLAHRNLPLRHLNSLAGIRVGVPREWLEGRLGITVRHDFENLLVQMRQAGAEILDVQPENLKQASACYTTIVRAEAAFIHQNSLKTNPEGFSSLVRPALEDGASLTAGVYLEARAKRRLVRTGLENTFGQVDALVLPAAPLGAPLRGTQEVRLESGMRSHRDAFIELTIPFSLVGLPTLSVPFTKESGLPVGLQIVAARGDDSTALELGWWLERNL
jgi:aspartyl-tRNA(Asn)/glutamyl-tRNA(Gln) amidotransferase subunit A